MNMVGVLERADWTREGWTIPGTHAAMHQDFAGWHADIHAMIDAIPQPYLWALKLRRPLPFWGQGRITLLGDACHPTLPFLAQGAVMAIEDAMLLARALGSLPVEEALRRYEAARYGRTSLVIERSWAMAGRYHDGRLSTPAGAAAAAGELTLERMRERFDWLYRYDATTVPLE
jgi:salicylate hydroxylase